MDTAQYKALLERISSEVRAGPVVSIDGRLIAHDHYPVHRAAAVRKWFEDQVTLEEMPRWSIQSSDLMVMNAIWDDFMEELNRTTSIVPNVDQLWTEVLQTWPEFVDNQLVAYHVDQLPEKIIKIWDKPIPGHSA